MSILNPKELLHAIALTNKLRHSSTKHGSTDSSCITHTDVVSNGANLLTRKERMSIRQIAGLYGNDAKSFNRMLRNFNIQYKENGTWKLHSKYENRGYTEYISGINEDGEYTAMSWTMKGRAFLYDFLKSKNILPIVEVN